MSSMEQSLPENRTDAKTVAARGDGATQGGLLESSHGRTTIADTVVAKIAGIATREVNGVYGLGGSATRAFGVIRERIPGGSTNLSQGISVEVGERQAAVDVDIVAEYGVSIPELAKGIRRNVIAAIEQMTGLEVIEVNVSVHDVHIPSEDDDFDTSDGVSRVQ